MTDSLLFKNSSGLHLNLILSNDFRIILIIHYLPIKSNILHLLIMCSYCWYPKQILFRIINLWLLNTNLLLWNLMILCPLSILDVSILEQAFL